MTTEKKSKSNKKKSIELMTALYKKHYDELWSKLPATSQRLIIEEPLGRRAKSFAHEVAKKAESEAYDLEKIKSKVEDSLKKYLEK